ncbi:MAG TPA: MnhB domain-containing protein [Acidimicrobiales bacterium]|nr:MnhB domain-containing protein [Acidimicrobiales bacterium]
MRTGRPLGAQRSPILDEVARLVFHTVLVLSFYLLLAGHNAPGGGFIGGLVAGAALVLRYVASGRDDTGVRFGFEPLLGFGLLIAGGTGAASLVAGDQFLESWVFERDVALLGTVKFTAALPFDIGVYLVVVGLVVAVLDSLGREADVDAPNLVEADPVQPPTSPPDTVGPQPEDRP